MIKQFPLLCLLFLSYSVHSQIKENLYQLNTLDTLLTDKVKGVLHQNLQGKQVVFLGEAVHYSGSDFLAKAEFVKYLVTEEGYTEIAFESDFFALLFDHDKRNLYRMWSRSDQCAPMMDFLKRNNVTIWGFDNRIASYYSRTAFTHLLSDFLKNRGVVADANFYYLTNIVLKNEYETPKLLSKKDVAYLKATVRGLLENDKIASDGLWKQILESYQSALELYTIKDNNSDEKRIPIRDRQMARNLDFLVKQNPDKKFIVWLANGHMSKANHDFMKGETMGYQFRQLAPGTSYHVAFGTIRMPPEKSEKSIRKAANDRGNILSCLPSVDQNYFLDADRLVQYAPEFKDKQFSGVRMFNMQRDKADILSHFDAIVFIANGIEVSYAQQDKSSSKQP